MGAWTLGVPRVQGERYATPRGMVSAVYQSGLCHSLGRSALFKFLSVLLLLMPLWDSSLGAGKQIDRSRNPPPWPQVRASSPARWRRRLKSCRRPRVATRTRWLDCWSLVAHRVFRWERSADRQTGSPSQVTVTALEARGRSPKRRHSGSSRAGERPPSRLAEYTGRCDAYACYDVEPTAGDMGDALFREEVGSAGRASCTCCVDVHFYDGVSLDSKVRMYLVVLAMQFAFRLWS